MRCQASTAPIKEPDGLKQVQAPGPLGPMEPSGPASRAMRRNLSHPSVGGVPRCFARKPRLRSQASFAASGL